MPQSRLEEWIPGLRYARPGMTKPIPSSLRANGSRECAPDDRLREAIHFCRLRFWISSSLALLAMTNRKQLLFT